MFFEGKYVVEGNVLVVPAKRRRSPRSATPNAAVLYPGMTPTSHFQLRPIYSKRFKPPHPANGPCGCLQTTPAAMCRVFLL